MNELEEKTQIELINLVEQRKPWLYDIQEKEYETLAEQRVRYKIKCQKKSNKD